MKKNKSVSIAKLAGLSTGLLQEQAAAYLASGSYKLTQEIYKILLKREDKPRYRQGLAQCYLKRALLAAEQRKYKDAITLWENFIEYAETPTANEHYVRWLLIAGQKAKLKTYLRSVNIETVERDYPSLACCLGFFYIGGQIDLSDYLPEDTPFAEQSRFAWQALDALQKNDRQRMDASLAKLPFRSVYRDFRTLLNAMSLILEAPAQAADRLGKIAADSPYHAVARLMAVLPLTGKPLIDALLTLGHKQQQMICHAKGWTEQQIKLLQYLGRQKQPLTDKTKFEVAIHYQNLLGKDYARRFCAALLPAYTAGERVYQKEFGRLDDFEKLRIAALRAEGREKLYEAIDYWDQCLEMLQADPQQNALPIALILRRIASLCPPDEAVGYQLESLRFDPDDKETHLKILDHYERKGDKARHKKRLQETLTRFPDDIDVLGLAMRTAVGNKTYKKAAQFAQKILAVDPVNTGAKQLLFSSYLNHARKLLKDEKFHLAAKEIERAETLKPGKHGLALAQMLAGFLIYLSEDKSKGAQRIKDSCKLSQEGDFIGRYRIINEAMQLDVPLAPLLRAIGPLREDYVLSVAELNALLKLLDTQRKEDNPYLFKTLEKVKKDFKRLTKAMSLTQPQLLTLMQCLDRIGHFELMRHCLNHCVSGTKLVPVWVFYRIYIQAKGNPAKVSPFDITRLQFQLENAREEGDQRTATRIVDFLDKIFQAYDVFPDAPAAEADDPYETLFERIDTRTYAKISRKLDQLQATLTEDKLVKLLLDLIPDKKNIALLFHDLDAFNALLFLAAARELNIDINVTAEAIIALARENNRSVPF